MALHPSPARADGKRIITGTSLATGGDYGDAVVWDSFTGQRLLQLHGHTENPIYFAFSPDGTRIATAGNDMTARIWDASDGQELLALTAHTDIVQGLAFSPDGLTLATCSWDGSARLWRASPPK